jgi:phosphoglycolate phosphatase-like HAD superfamily hydrolase
MNDRAVAAWDEYDAYLFDIDGTLLNCTDAVHYFAFCETLSGLAGRPMNLDGVVAHGNTDVGILRDALRLAQVPEAAWRPRLEEARRGMCDFVAERKHELCVAVLPGAREVLDYLRGKGAVLGVATGNLADIGRMKLERAGLWELFDFGGFSDAFEYRRDVFGAALETARSLAGAEARVCVFGDTPEDIRAARANGLDVFAVATGIYSCEDLNAEDPTVCLFSLRELMEHKQASG